MMGVTIGGTDITPEDALSHVSGYMLCLDMTAREIQEIAKKKGEPWSVAKGSDKQLQRVERAHAMTGGEANSPPGAQCSSEWLP